MKTLQEITLKWQDEKRIHPVIMYGSSNTEIMSHSQGRLNWTLYLDMSIRENVGRQVAMINRGLCGDTAAGLLQRCERDIIWFNPSFVIVTIGGNDVWQGYPVLDYKDNLSKLASRLSDKGIDFAFQTYFCPVIKEMGEDYILFDHYMEAKREVCRNFGMPVIEQYNYFKPFHNGATDEYAKTLMADGLHLNPVGNAVMGILASRAFDLPDPPIANDIQESVYNSIKRMGDFTDLPPQVIL